ncbi:MAG: hypothetical protein J3Q66DRAFT_373602 [Benniella sp.]|nr:MAG: hypothetical protein J3Q66DRAFT_373602 [Benniella sp.]
MSDYTFGFPHDQVQPDEDDNATGLDIDDILTLPEDFLLDPHLASSLSDKFDPMCNEVRGGAKQLSGIAVNGETTHHSPLSTDINVPSWMLPTAGEQQVSDLADLSLAATLICANSLGNPTSYESILAHNNSHSPQQHQVPFQLDPQQARITVLEHQVQQLQLQLFRQSNQAESMQQQQMSHHLQHSQQMNVPQVTSSSLQHTPDSLSNDMQHLIHPWAEETGLSTMDVDYNGQTSQEGSTSNIGSITLEACTDRQKKSKRPRKALQLQERLAIIEFCEEHPDISVVAISKKFNVPRTTIYGIMKDKDRLKNFTKSRANRELTLEKYSTAESRFRILEELLVAWSCDIGSRGFTLTDKKIRAQAFEIYRMLSGLVSESLPPCTFSSGWLQRFKKRRNEPTWANRNTGNTTDQNDDWSFPEGSLSQFSGNPEDIWMCGVTSVYLGMLPTRFYDGSGEESVRDAPVASVILCCDAAGTNIRSTHTFVRAVKTGEEYDKGSSSGADDLSVSELMKWLRDIDRHLHRKIVLVMDLSIWNALQPNLEAHRELQDPLASLRAQLKNITIVKIPEAHAASHPMSAGLVSEFKLLFLYFLLGLDVKMEKREAFREHADLNDRGTCIKNAWFCVRESTIQNSFEMVVKSVQKWTPFQESPHRKEGRRAPLNHDKPIYPQEPRDDFTPVYEFEQNYFTKPRPMNYRILAENAPSWNNYSDWNLPVPYLSDLSPSRELREIFVYNLYNLPEVRKIRRESCNRFSEPTIFNDPWIYLTEKDRSFELRKIFPNVPDTVIQYYLTQEADVGPSSFLRTKVHEMQHHEDFGGCFGSPNFGQANYLKFQTSLKIYRE